MIRKALRQGVLVRVGASALALVLAAAIMGPGAAEAQRGQGGQSGQAGKERPAPPRPLGPSYEYSSGIVLSYEPVKHILTLSTGGVYQVRGALRDQTLSPGDKVKLRWIRDAGERMADQVEITMKAPAPAAPTTAAVQAPTAPTTEPAPPPAS